MLVPALRMTKPADKDQARREKIEQAEDRVFQIRKRIRLEPITSYLLGELSDAMDESVKARATLAEIR